MNSNLNARQMRFVDEYVLNLNGTEAAIRAGYSVKTARVIASQNLRKPAIAAELAKRRKRFVEQLDLRTLRIIVEVARMAYADMSGAFGENGMLKPPQEWPKEAWDGIECVDYYDEVGGVGADGRKKRGRRRLNIKSAKLKALGLLSELAGLIQPGSKSRLKL